MGRVADETGIQFRMLGSAKGAAARGPRCQSDRHLYREAATREVQRAQGVYERLMMLLQNVGISRSIDQETLSILEDNENIDHIFITQHIPAFS